MYPFKTPADCVWSQRDFLREIQRQPEPVERFQWILCLLPIRRTRLSNPRSCSQTGAAKVILFLIGCFFGFIVYRTTADSFIKSYYSYPEHARNWIVALAVLFYVSWSMFPVLWLSGPEGYGALPLSGSLVLHGLLDILS